MFCGLVGVFFSSCCCGIILLFFPSQGAVENVLERSTHVQLLDGTVKEMTEEARSVLLSKIYSMSTKCLRCLGLAYTDDLGDLSDYDGESHSAHKLLLDPMNYDDIESRLIFVGMAGLRVNFLRLCTVNCFDCFDTSFISWNRGCEMMN